MKKSDIEYMAQFKPGQIIKIINANHHTDTIGKTAEIIKVIKTKMELQVNIFDGFIPHYEQMKMEKNPDYIPFKHYEYYPNAKNVEIIKG